MGALKGENQSFSVIIEDTRERFNCKRYQHVLSAMSQMGKKGIPSGCHVGGYGVCKIQINEGTYKTKIMSRAHVPTDEEKAGCVLVCRVFHYQ